MKGATSDGGSVRGKMDNELKLADALKQHQSFIHGRLMETNKLSFMED